MNHGGPAEVEGTPENLPRRPGQRLQSSIKSKRFRLTAYAARVDADSTCSICISPMEENDVVKELLCRHCYHAECLDEWLAVSLLCPLCKQRAAPALASETATSGAAGVTWLGFWNKMYPLTRLTHPRQDGATETSTPHSNGSGSERA